MKRADILSAVKTRLQTIATSSGYITNLGRNVGLWRTVPLSDAELPFCNIRDTMEEVTDDSQGGAVGRMVRRQVTVEFEIVSPDLTSIRNCQEDVEKAIGVDETFGGLATRTQPVSSELLANQERDAIAGVLLTVRIDYRTGRWSAS